MGAFAAGVAVGAAAAGLAAWALWRRRRLRLGRFLSFAVHELNSPLTAVTMTVSNLMAGVFGATAEEQKPWLELLQEQTARLRGLVGELRDFVHLELREDLALQIEDEPAASLAQKAAGSVQAGLAQAKVPFELDVEQGLPDVRCDPDRACRSVAALLYHARKFRSEGPIKLSTRREGETVAFEVSYSGSEAADGEDCFDLMYPAGDAKQTLKATGLGLGLLGELARRQGGGLTMECSGRTRLLRFTLPASK